MALIGHFVDFVGDCQPERSGGSPESDGFFSVMSSQAVLQSDGAHKEIYNHSWNDLH